MHAKAGFIFLLIWTAAVELAHAQTTRFRILDSLTQQPIIGAAVGIVGTTIGALADLDGIATLSSLPAGKKVSIQALDYRAKEVAINDTMAGKLITVLLFSDAEEIEEVVVSTTRTNSRIDDLALRVEVLGEDDMVEENGIKPANIASLLGDIAGTQIQPTSPTTGNADLRIQGLQGRYSQILRDGMPLLGGYAGGFGILQIPPLDLKQIELIKGSQSTLYGGGAIAGLVNLVSKAPLLNSPEYAFTVNQSTLKESNLNGFASGRNQHFGYTFFAGATRQQAVDVNGDGFADVPKLRSITVHPRFFIYTPRNGQIVVGYTGLLEERKGGSMGRIKSEADTGFSPYFVTNSMQRHNVDVLYTQPFAIGTLSVKAALSGFTRRSQTNTVDYDATQLSYFTEASYLLNLKEKHTIVAGINVNGEQLKPKAGSRSPLQNPYNYQTLGAFIQEDWKLTKAFTLQAGLRTDHHNRFGNFVLPRLGILAKPSETVTVRLNSGLGYRAPVPYVNELDEREYPIIRTLTGVKPERSLGVNGDVNWRVPILRGVTLTLNQAFFYTRLDNPMVLITPPDNLAALQWVSAGKPVITKGLESYARLRVHETELYLGYVYTDARRKYDPVRPNVELAARHKFSTVIVQEFGAHFGAGLEASYTGTQYLSDGSRTPAYIIAALMLRYRTGPWTVVLNGENLLDYRQTRREAVVLMPYSNPGFRQLWAPVEGRVINLSVSFRMGGVK